MLTDKDIQKQSEAAYHQWRDQWRKHAKEHAKYPQKPLTDFENSGVGRAVLCVANGYSFEDEIETIKKYHANVDIICCDKTLGHLLNHGIKPTFCLVADANVSYERYLKPWEGQLEETIFIGNVCCNPLWAEKGNWKDRYFYSVKDILKSEREWTALSGTPNVIAAGTNVSNSLVIVLTQSDNAGRKNFFGYDKILLIGFDYSWSHDGKYYAFDEDGAGKRNYMKHAYLMDRRGEFCYSSTNLIFSARWLDQYVSTFQLPVVQCTKRTVFAAGKQGILSEQMQYRFRPEDSEKVRQLQALRERLVKQKRECESILSSLAKDHYYSFVQSV